LSFLLPNAAKLDTESALINGAGFTTAKMRLLASNITIGASTTLSALLAGEASFTGYSAVTLSSWGTPALDGSNRAASLNTQGQFVPTSGGGSGNLYGYFLTDSGGTHLYGGENFAGAPITVAQSVTLEIDFTYLMDSLF
jgi:hypothetical protein